MQRMNFGIVLLAAGNSSRMNQAKQLLAYRGTTLLRHAIATALGVGARGGVVLVLGARAEQMKKEVADLAVEMVVNPDWELGMGSSIRAGVTHLMQLAEKNGGAIEGCIIMLCDQPLVTAAHLAMLLDEHHRSGKTIIASGYGRDRGAGVPAFFSRAFFDRLASLPADSGGRTLIHQYPQDVGIVGIEAAIVDIDTAEDYRKLL